MNHYVFVFLTFVAGRHLSQLAVAASATAAVTDGPETVTTEPLTATVSDVTLVSTATGTSDIVVTVPLPRDQNTMVAETVAPSTSKPDAFTKIPIIKSKGQNDEKDSSAGLLFSKGDIISVIIAVCSLTVAIALTVIITCIVFKLKKAKRRLKQTNSDLLAVKSNTLYLTNRLRKENQAKDPPVTAFVPPPKPPKSDKATSDYYYNINGVARNNLISQKLMYNADRTYNWLRRSATTRMYRPDSDAVSRVGSDVYESNPTYYNLPKENTYYNDKTSSSGFVTGYASRIKRYNDLSESRQWQWSPTAAEHARSTSITPAWK